jgi:hypothetical protein
MRKTIFGMFNDGGSPAIRYIFSVGRFPLAVFRKTQDWEQITDNGKRTTKLAENKNISSC